MYYAPLLPVGERPLTRKEILSHPLVLYPTSYFMNQIYQQYFASTPMEPLISARLSTPYAMIHYCQKNEAGALLPERMLKTLGHHNGFLIYIIYYMLMVIIASEAIHSLHATVSEAGLAAGIFVLGTLVARPIAGVMFDRKGEDFVMYPTYACLAIGLLVLSFTAPSWEMLLAGIFVGLGYGTFMSNGQAICVKLVEEVRIGVAVSTYFVMLDLGLGVGPYILGAFKESLGFQGIYSAVGLGAIGCAVLYWLLYARRRRVRTEEGPEELEEV